MRKRDSKRQRGRKEKGLSKVKSRMKVEKRGGGEELERRKEGKKKE